jgi:23S rRNA pseudouridine1911/1915/1917 synthase
MSYIRYPLVGDHVYGGRLRIPPDCDPLFAEKLKLFRRQALHATSLGLLHPESGESLQFNVDMPTDMEELIAAARKDADRHSRK